MFIITQKRNQKRVPTHLQTSLLKKNPYIQSTPFKFPGMPESTTYVLNGESITRTPEWTVDVKLRHNMRVDGKIRSVTEHIGTCNYWAFINDYIQGEEKQGMRAEAFLRCEEFSDAMDNIVAKLRLFPEIETDRDYTRYNKEAERLRDEIVEKLAPYRKEAEIHFVTEYYENEAKWILENARVNKEVNRLEMAEKERKDQYKKQQQRQEQWQQGYQYSSNSSHINSNNMPYMTAEQKRMFNDIIKYGYRKLASEYHPDKSSGSEEKMMDLNDLKDLLDKTL